MIVNYTTEIPENCWVWGRHEKDGIHYRQLNRRIEGSEGEKVETVKQCFVPDPVEAKFDLFMVEAEKKNGYVSKNLIAKDMTRRDVADLAGRLLMSPMYAGAELVEKQVAGHWVDEKGGREMIVDGGLLPPWVIASGSLNIPLSDLTIYEVHSATGMVRVVAEKGWAPAAPYYMKGNVCYLSGTTEFKGSTAEYEKLMAEYRGSK